MNRDNEHELKLAQLLRQAEESNNGSKQLGAELDLLSSSESLSETDRRELQRARMALEALDRAGSADRNSRETFRNPVTEAEDGDAECRMGLPESLPAALGRFEILRELGRGGFAVVLLARDPNLDRHVALKIPQPHSLFSREAQERFLREARLAASLSHPAIVSVFESGKIGPLTYIVSEFCPGKTLAKWLAEQTAPVKPQLAARLVCRMADAVQHAHSRGVIHRDLKPGNVLLDNGNTLSGTEDDLIQSVRVSDFGLAKLVQEDSDLSRSEALIGTPAYMSPEQAAGRPDQVGPACDVYALGAILYELLVGKPPHRRATYLATLQAIQGENPVAPGKLNPSVPRDLAAICLKCLEKKPGSRYASAWDLEQDLQRFLVGKPVQARTVSRLENLGRWSRRNPAVATLGVVAFLSLAAGCAVATWQWWRAETSLAETRVQSDRARRHLDRLEYSIDRIFNDVSRFLAEVPQSESLQNELLQESLRLQEELLAEESNDPLVAFRTGQARRRTAELYLQMGNVPSAIATLQSAEVLLQNIDASQIETQKLAELVHVRLLCSNAWCRQGNGPNAVLAAGKAVDACRQYRILQPGPQATSDLANALRQLGVSHEMAGDLQKSGARFREAVELFRSPEIDLDEFSDDDRSQVEINLAQCLNSLGIFEKSIGRADVAEQKYLQGIELLNSVLDRRPSRIDLQNQLGTTALNLANLLFGQKRFDESEAQYQRSADIFDKLSVDFPQTRRYREMNLMAHSGLGLAQRRLDRIDDAIATLSDCIRETEIDIQVFGSSPAILTNLARLNGNLANIHLDILHDDEAGEAAIRKSIAICHSLLDDNPDAASSRLSLSIATGRLASISAARNDLQQAMTLIDAALADARLLMERNRRDPRYNNNLVWNLTARTRILAEAGDDQSAIDSAEEITGIDPDNRELWIEAARALGYCVHQLQTKPASDNAGRIGMYEVAAARYLSKAHDLGASDISQLLQSPPLSVFHNLPLLPEIPKTDSSGN